MGRWKTKGKDTPFFLVGLSVGWSVWLGSVRDGILSIGCQAVGGQGGLKERLGIMMAMTNFCFSLISIPDMNFSSQLFFLSPMGFNTIRYNLV